MSDQSRTLCPCPALFPQAALARRVPWPLQYASAPLNPGMFELGAARNTPLPCVRLGFALWYLPADQAQSLLRLALEAAQLVLVADFKMAERNLELPATFAAWGLMALTKTRRGTEAGQTAPPNSMQKGGIEGLVHQSKALVRERRPIFAGAAALLLLQRP
ncbi:MAG: hypothetical protein F8N36_10465 [Desulfovibrio sp.]|uniref:hypothetical protein n=1 Tax=Desulfovibrio sp. TaxID=885 RepID=UPI00135EE93D|nr:hypothetical protein [Desulfovibrio sp.]MTJ93272.1 hypothetical protein [Desulfovibrio sp.]